MIVFAIKYEKMLKTPMNVRVEGCFLNTFNSYFVCEIMYSSCKMPCKKLLR